MRQYSKYTEMYYFPENSNDQTIKLIRVVPWNLEYWFLDSLQIQKSYDVQAPYIKYSIIPYECSSLYFVFPLVLAKRTQGLTYFKLCH